MSAQQDPSSVEDSTNGDEAATSIFLTMDLAARAFAKWQAAFDAREGEWSPDLDGQRSAEYFFELVEEVATDGV